MRGALGDAEFEELYRLYSGPERFYHTLDHLAEMFELGVRLGLDECQIMAIWYHDAVYEVPGEDNEAKSADLAGLRLQGLGFDEPFVSVVQQIILDTKHHLPSIEASRLVIDLDLASLAAEPEIFDRNTERIRQEFAIIPEEDFRAGRAAFFKAYLARERLYHSDALAHLEAKARANLEHCLAP